MPSKVKSKEEATRVFQKAHPEETITSVHDLDDCYVINSYPTAMGEEKAQTLIRNPLAVEKSTGKIFTFNPLLHGKKKQPVKHSAEDDFITGNTTTLKNAEEYMVRGREYLNKFGR